MSLMHIYMFAGFVSNVHLYTKSPTPFKVRNHKNIVQNSESKWVWSGNATITDQATPRGRDTEPLQPHDSKYTIKFKQKLSLSLSISLSAWSARWKCT